MDDLELSAVTRLSRPLETLKKSRPDVIIPAYRLVVCVPDDDDTWKGDCVDKKLQVTFRLRGTLYAPAIGGGSRQFSFTQHWEEP
jgi:hypothetical protein